MTDDETITDDDLFFGPVWPPIDINKFAETLGDNKSANDSRKDGNSNKGEKVHGAGVEMCGN